MKNTLTALVLLGVLAGGTPVYAAISGKFMIHPAGTKEYTLETIGKINCPSKTMLKGPTKPLECKMQDAIDGPLLTIRSKDKDVNCQIKVKNDKLTWEGCRGNVATKETFLP